MEPLSRRTLLSGVSASALMSSAARAAVRLPAKVRLVLIGGKGHTGEVLSELPHLPDVQLTAYFEPGREDRQRLERNRFVAGAKRYDDYREMLDREKPDIAAICTSNAERVEPILAASERKIHWIAEKPLALDRPSLNRIRQATESSGVHLSMMLPMRYASTYRAVKRAVDAGLIGEVAQISSQKSYKPGSRAEWMRHKSTYGGTILWIAIHMVDLMRWSSGREFTEAFSYHTRIGDFPGIGEMENVTGSIFRLDNGGVALLRMDYLRTETAPTHGDDRLRLAGTKGVVEYQAATGVTLMAADRPPESIRDLPAEGSVFVDFLESIYNGKPPTLTAQDVFRTNLIVIAAHESAEQGRIVRI